jgi:Tol biopolymer transport system component
MLGHTARRQRSQIFVEPGWRSVFFRPVWSPDSTQLLVNKLRNLDRLSVDVYQFDLSTGKSTRKLKDGVPVLAWAESPL